MLGIVSAEPYGFDLVLEQAPRSMAILSREHQDGWGLASHSAERGDAWTVHRSTRTAILDPDFAKVAQRTRGRVVIAHVRQKTVGALADANTHPFHDAPWVFAHNGTVEDLDFVRAQTRGERRARLRGDTDSEELFAYLLSRLDAVGRTLAPADEVTDAIVAAAIREATRNQRSASLNFFLSNGQALYAGRFGRPLYVLERVPTTPRASPHSCCDVPITQRRCIVVASECITNEPWREVAHGEILRIDASPSPRSRSVR
jgi:glutamine amidotransferase